MQFKIKDLDILLNEIKKIQAGKYNIDFMRFVIDSSMVFLGAIFFIKEYTPDEIRTFEIDTTKHRITYRSTKEALAWCECPPTLREQLKEYAKNQFIYRLQNKEKILV